MVPLEAGASTRNGRNVPPKTGLEKNALLLCRGSVWGKVDTSTVTARACATSGRNGPVVVTTKPGLAASWTDAVTTSPPGPTDTDGADAKESPDALNS